MITLWSSNTPIIDCPVIFEAGSVASSLSGATVSASAKSGTTVVDALTCSITGNTIRGTWATGALSAGRWRVQFEAVIGGNTQTVGDEIVLVNPSN